MANRVLYAHTGEIYDYDPVAFNLLDEFKSWIAQQVNIAPTNQILTTVKGALVKFPALSSERELFLYSRHYIVPNAPTTAPIFPIPPLSKPQAPPDRLENQNDLSSWKTLFANRLTWANGILAHANDLVAEIEDVNNGIAIMQRSVAVAASNLDTHVRSAVGNYEDLKGWAFDSLKDQEKLLGSWETSMTRLPRILVHPEVAKVMRNEKRSKRDIENLMGMVDAEEVRRAGKSLGDIAVGFERKVTQLGASVEQIRQKTEELADEIDFGKRQNEDGSPEEAQYIHTDIAAVVSKIQQDHDHIASMSNTPKAIAPASKTAHNHTTNLLPNLMEWILDLSKIAQSGVQRKNAVSQLCLKHLQTVSQLEQRLYTDLISAVKRVESDYDKESSPSFHLLTLVTHLPGIYGSFLVECVRRKEWNERMRSDGAKLAEELAGLKEEEEKRRKKWYKNATQSGDLTVDFLPAESATGGMILDLNLAPDSMTWPNIARNELDDLLNTLKSVDGLDSLVRDLAQQMIDLDKPSRRQRKSLTPTLATRAFKMGSIHEAALGNMSMLRDVDENVQIKMLKDDRAKWDDRVKMYESRIRKLEDLLHRQRNSGNAGGVQFGQLNSSAQSPIMAEPMSRNSSQGDHGVGMPVLDRRVSSDGAQKLLATKIQALEKELATEKETASRLEKDLVTEKETATRLQQDMDKREIAEKNLNERMTEAHDTKKDLLANLEQQAAEFNNERNVLQEKLRDLEESLEGWKQRVEEVYTECDKLEDLRADEVRKRENAEEEVASLAMDIKAVQASLSDQGAKSASVELDVARAVKELDDVKSSHEQKVSELRTAQADLAQKNKDLQTEKAQSKEYQECIAILGKQLEESEQNLEEERNFHQKSNETEHSASKVLKNAYTTLRHTLEDGHSLSRTPSDNLATLPIEVQGVALATASRINELNVKLTQEQMSAKSLRDQHKQLQSRFDARTLRARDLTQKLYTHNMRAVQMLENLGFSVVVRDGSTHISRVSRSSNSANASHANVAESLSMSMSMLPVMTKQKFTDGNNNAFNDLELLYWMEAEDSEVESEKYTAYLNAIGNFDADGFTEALTKRVKDLETSARKWQKHSRDYRDKYHRMQSESSEKIAFRSFKEGDLAMFLPTRNQATRPWAAFNVGAPHYFLREQDSHKLQAREWLVARISKVEERIVDLSRSAASIGAPPGIYADRASLNSSEGGIDEENPFQLSDGLRWYLLDATEEKPGAPTTPGLGSSTVASANVDAKGSLKSRKPVTGAKKTLSKNLQQGGTSSVAGEASSVKSRPSLTSLGKRGSGGSAGISKPVPPITNLPDGSAVADGADAVAGGLEA